MGRKPARGMRAFELIAFAAACLWLLSLPVAASAEGDCELGQFAAGDEDGIGGTGLGGDEDGIGGTGFGGDEDGIGGTGVLGTITDLGSICVNGLAVHYGPDVRVTANGRSLSSRSLAVGQVVWIVASKPERVLEADSITIVTELVGVTSAVDPVKRTLEVAGESIDVLEDAVVFGIRGGPLRIEAGFRIAVSGLRRPSGRIAASRIDLALSDSRANPPRIADLMREAPGLRWLSIEGYVGAPQAGELLAEGRFQLGSLEVDASGSIDAAAEPEGRVWVRGVIDGSLLRAERIVPYPGEPAGGGADLPPPGGEVEPAKEPDVANETQRRPERSESLTPDRIELEEILLHPEVPAVRESPIDPGDRGQIEVFDGANGR